MGRCTLLQTQLQDCLALLGGWHSLQQRRRAAETAAQHAVLADQQRRDAALRALPGTVLGTVRTVFGHWQRWGDAGPGSPPVCRFVNELFHR